jgi:hypothetical protein
VFYLIEYVKATPVPIHFQENSKDILQHPQADLFKIFIGLLRLLTVG